MCEPHPFCCLWSYETHMSNQEELHGSDSLLIQEGPYKDIAGKRHCLREFEAVWYQNQGKYYQFCARPFEELKEAEEEDGDIRVLAISLKQCVLPPLRVLLCTETLIGHVMCLKGLIGATFESSELLYLFKT